MRVSQRSLFNNFVTNMQYSLSSLMDSNIQASSQKRVNTPSDDPVGAARILNYRDSLRSIDQYRTNVDTAKGWLGLADNTLVSANTVLTRVKELAEQAATGTYDATNREEIGYEIRQLFEQLVTIANTQYESKHIFGGHKTDQPAFTAGLWMTTSDTNVADKAFSLTGSADRTIMVQFLTSGDVGTDALDYRYSSDGGSTWTTATLAAGSNKLDLGTCELTLTNGTTVTQVDTTNPHETSNGTWMYIRPQAIYQGDDEDAIEVDPFGSSLDAQARGLFDSNVIVRIDSATTLASNISYSYSLDSGLTWVTGNSAQSATASSATLTLPGGYLDLVSNSGNLLSSGSQFVIRPRTGQVRFEISPSEWVTVNSIGKDVFGGAYTDPSSSNATLALGGSAKNMFDVVGRLVGYIETNNQAGIQQALAEVDTARQHLMTKAASVGAKENRLDVADNVLSSMELDESSRMSKIEDVDVAELMTKLAQQELAYQSVLKSSSMILKLNLMNFM